jgi:hypothetical protein
MNSLLKLAPRPVALLGFLCAVGLLGLMASCERSDEALSPVPGTQPAPGLSAPFDVGAVIRQVHFAWRPDEGGFSAGHSTHAVRASAQGGWSVTPFHQPVDEAMLRGTPLHLQTASLSRGGRALAVPARATAGSDGSLTFSAGAVVERLRNTEDGVEQRWTFARRPEGAGALTVRLRAEGVPYVGETSSGLHFADPSGLGVRYGTGVWTDARGAQRQVPVRYEAGQVVLEVSSEWVETAEYPATLSPLISPEFGMDGPVSGPAARIQSLPDIGFDGQNFLVVWQDSRGASTDVYDIFGARVSPAGVVMDPSGFSISSAVGDQRAPALAFDGQNFLVVWQDSRTGSPRIHASRVTPAGVVMDANSLPLNASTAAQTWPAVAFDGQNFLVAWQDFRAGGSNSNIHGTRVSPTGAVLDASGIVICAEPFAQATPSMAFDGQNYFLVWQDQRAGGGAHIFGGRVSPAGAVLDGPGFAVSSPISVELSPAVAFDGSNYLVVWQDDRSGLSYDIYGTRVSPSGAVLDASGFAIVSTSLSQQAPALAFDGQNYVVVWQDARTDGAFDIYGARVAPDRTVSTSFPVSRGTGGQVNPAVASGGGVTLAIWSDSRTSSAADLYGARLGASGGPIEAAGFLVATSANAQLAPAVASSGQDYLVVWQDDRGGAYDIYGVRVDAQGTVLDPLGIAISSAVNNQTSPAAVYDGQSYFVVWQDQRGATSDIYGARVNLAGQVIDPAGIAISTATKSQLRPAVAFDGQNHLVVWYDDRADFSPDIYGARVSAAGTVLDATGFPIAVAANSQLVPAVAFDGQNHLVVWHDFRNGSSADIYGARVAPDGTVLDATGLALSRAASSQTSVGVAASGQNALVVWRDLRNPSAEVYGTRVLPDGTVLDPAGIAITSAPDDQAFPSVAYDGQSYLVVWQQSQAGGPNDLHGARVALDGSVLDPAGFTVSADSSDELAPRVAAGGTGHLLVVYQRMDAQAPYGTQRVRARFITASGEPPDGGVPDAGSSDGGAPDAGGIPDAGSIDAGIPDAGGFDAGAPDSGLPDAGGFDAGMPDSGLPDAGGFDAGIPDPGAPDSGTTDAGSLDAGSPDASVPDSGVEDPEVPDAGEPDAGDPDAGAPDAGSPDPAPPDAGEPDAGGPGTAPDIDAPSRCGCASGGASPGLWLGGLFLAFVLERRRGRAGRPRR